MNFLPSAGDGRQPPPAFSGGETISRRFLRGIAKD